jgi:uncharacterized membrane protein
MDEETLERRRQQAQMTPAKWNLAALGLALIFVLALVFQALV